MRHGERHVFLGVRTSGADCRIIVTDRGRPVAELVQHRPQRSRLQRWIDEGRVIPAAGRLEPAWQPGDPVTTDLTDELHRMRGEERQL